MTTQIITIHVGGKDYQIKTVCTNDEPYFCGKDICMVLGYENIKSALHNNVDGKNKKALNKLVTSNISYHEGKDIYLSTKGVVSLLTRLIKTDEEVIREFSRVLKIDLSCNTTITKEEETIGAIVKALREIEPLKRQYIVGQYRIDLYFPRLKLAVECDEHDHRDRNAELERTREEYIKSYLVSSFDLIQMINGSMYLS